MRFETLVFENEHALYLRVTSSLTEPMYASLLFLRNASISDLMFVGASLLRT